MTTGIGFAAQSNSATAAMSAAEMPRLARVSARKTSSSISSMSRKLGRDVTRDNAEPFAPMRYAARVAFRLRFLRGARNLGWSRQRIKGPLMSTLITARSSTGVYHRAYAQGPAHCSRRLHVTKAREADIERASAESFCSKCFPNGKPAGGR